jgi:hypothetical protein
MPDVPIATNIYTALTPYQARGVDYSFLGNLPDAYWAGQQQRYQQNLQNLFQGGVPSDLGQLGTKILQAGGVPQIPNYLALQRLNMPIQPLAGEGVNYEATQRQPLPPSTAQTGSIGIRTPNAPQGAGDTSPTVGSLADRARLTGQDRIDFVNQFGGDESRLADLSDPRTRNMVASFIKQKEGQLSAQPPTTQTPAGAAPASAQAGDTVSPVAYGQFKGGATAPQFQPQAGFQVAQAPVAGAEPRPAPPGYTSGRAAQLRQFGQQNLTTAATMDIRLGKGAGDSYRDAGNKQIEQAQKIDDFLSEQAKATPEEKTFLSGVQGLSEKQKSDVARADAGYTGIRGKSIQYQEEVSPFLKLTQGIVNDPKFTSGVGADTRLLVNRVRQAMGDQNAAVLQEGLQKMTASSVLSQMVNLKSQMEAISGGTGSNSGRIFGQYVELAQRASPQLETTPAGIRFLTQVQQRMGELSVRVHQMADEYRTQRLPNGQLAHPLGLDEGFDRILSSYLRDPRTAPFSKDELSHPQLLGVPTVPPSLDRKGNIPQITIWARSMGVGPNDPIRFQDGSYGRLH